MLFLHSPFQPALDSKAPVSVLLLFLKIPATARPEKKSMPIKRINVAIPVSHPPNSDAMMLPMMPVDVHNMFFIFYLNSYLVKVYIVSNRFKYFLLKN
jgi:hypothetical protein